MAETDMKGHMIPYVIINLGGLSLVIVMGVFYIFYAKGKIGSKTLHIMNATFAVVMIVLGLYVLSISGILQTVYPQKHYSVGAWIAIALGVLILPSFFWGRKKSR